MYSTRLGNLFTIIFSISVLTITFTEAQARCPVSRISLKDTTPLMMLQRNRPLRNQKNHSQHQSYNQTLKKFQEQQKSIQQQLQETIEEFNEAVSDGVGDVLEIGSERASKAIENIRSFVDLMKSGPEIRESIHQKEWWLATSKALESGVTLLDYAYQLIPALKKNPNAILFVESLTAGTKVINLTEHAYALEDTGNRVLVLADALKKYEQAIAQLKHLIAESRNQDDSEKPHQTQDGQKAKLAVSLDELLEAASHKIEGIKENTEPIFLDYESDGVRTETPPPNLTGEELQKWLDRHQDFLKLAKQKLSSRSNLKKALPARLLEKGNEQELAKWLAKHPTLLRRVLENNLPPEGKDNPIVLSDQQATSMSQIPKGWIECQCPYDHPGLGIFIKEKDGTIRQFHDPSFRCR